MSPPMKESSARPKAVRERLAERLHRERSSRDVSIVTAATEVAPPAPTTMLDIGCSDGRIARQVADALDIDEVQGVDVQVQPRPAIDVQAYDGTTLPFDDATFDLVTIVDVLHHCDDPEAVLRESLRVVADGGRVVVKDHVRHGPWSNFVLLLMDTASNYSVHEVTRGTYLSMPEWESLVAECDAAVMERRFPFRVHGLPWRLVARDRYHVVFSLHPASR